MASGSSSQSASKGCRPCNLRRIRCDRTLPLCAKCGAKGIVCPGYGPRFRWTNAIASRGRFKGHTAPDISQISPSQDTRAKSPGHVPNEPLDKQECQSDIIAMPQPLPEPVASRLLQHYITNIAPLMVWVDSEQNEYKRLAVSLSETEPVLRLAILAIAAKHTTQISEVEDRFSKSACQTVVLLITERVRKLTFSKLEASEVSLDSDVGTTEAILAAMLVLSNYSLLGSDLSLAQFHMRGVRTLIDAISFNGTSDNCLFMFLKNQAAIYDILACTTRFNIDHIEHTILPELSHGPLLFGDFLNTIHNITMQSVQPGHAESSPPCSTAKEIEDQFELARGSTLLAAGPLSTLRNRSLKHDFVRLVDSYHHAGLIYACKRLHAANIDVSEDYHSSRLFHVLQQFENINTCLPNLPWPIFMAGICSCRNQERMRITSNLCQMLSANTRFGHYDNMSIFFQELWTSPHQDWLLLAREWEDRGVPIVAV